MTNRPSFTAHVDQSNGGLELALSAVALGLFGWWLDRRLGSSPVFLLICGIVGFVGAALSLYYRYTARITQLRAESEALRRGARPADRAGTEPAAADRTSGTTP